MAQKNLKITQGTSFEWLILIKDVNGNPLDMTYYNNSGAGARGMIRNKYNDATAAINFDVSMVNKSGVLAAIDAGLCHLSSSEIATLEPNTSGKCYLLITIPAKSEGLIIGTDSLSKESYVYDLEIRDTFGFVFKPYYGTVTVSPEATK